ncbi:MAG TPA: PIN domain-containing protein [Thermoanaerobaculia bacterium]|nr:PIN domain-containing protein [Thermoanaerobaculia bacterium]
MSGVVVDTSAWIEFFAGREVPGLEDALAAGQIVLAPVVVEAGQRAPTASGREKISALVADFAVHETPVGHWIRVAEPRRRLNARGLSISTPDPHVAQCALDRDAHLLARDQIFSHIAKLEPLKLIAG